MAIKHKIPITNGLGSTEIVNGKYNATADIPGYDNSSLSPKSIEIGDNIETYVFTISASGILKLHVTDTGDPSTGVNIIGAKFIRTDYTGNNIGIEVETNQDGYAIFNNVPFSENKSLKVYYKQISSDGKHTFSEELKNIELKKNEEIIEIANPEAPLKKFSISDINYATIPIADGDLFLEETT